MPPTFPAALLATPRSSCKGAAAGKWGGPAGFFLATSADDAGAFAARRGGAVIRFRISQEAAASLKAAGAELRLIPGTPISLRTEGSEFFVPESLFGLFNNLWDEGAISVFL
jgi:hypothetical protein